MAHCVHSVHSCGMQRLCIFFCTSDTRCTTYSAHCTLRTVHFVPSALCMTSSAEFPRAGRCGPVQLWCRDNSPRALISHATVNNCLRRCSVGQADWSRKGTHANPATHSSTHGSTHGSTRDSPRDSTYVPTHWLYPSTSTQSSTRGSTDGDKEGAETHRAVHRSRQRMQRFSAMYTLSEGRQGRGGNTLKWETFVHASSGGKKIALRGGGGDTEAHFPNPPPSLTAMTGGGGSGRGRPTCRADGEGGGGSTQHLWLKMIPTSR